MDNAAAAFTAAYSDFKLVKTRGVVQIIFELPIEQSTAALEALGGMPSQQEAVWCAVARLSQQGAAQPQPVTPTIHPTPAGAVVKSYAQVIAIMCNERAFQRFVCEFDKGIWDEMAPSHNEYTADVVRRYCSVASRAEIREGTSAGNRWLLLLSAYRAWQEAPRVGAA